MNAGDRVLAPIDLQTDQEVEKIYTLNALHVVYMSKVIIEKMV